MTSKRNALQSSKFALPSSLVLVLALLVLAAAAPANAQDAKGEVLPLLEGTPNPTPISEILGISTAGARAAAPASLEDIKRVIANQENGAATLRALEAGAGRGGSESFGRQVLEHRNGWTLDNQTVAVFFGAQSAFDNLGYPTFVLPNYTFNFIPSRQTHVSNGMILLRVYSTGGYYVMTVNQTVQNASVTFYNQYKIPVGGGSGPVLTYAANLGPGYHDFYVFPNNTYIGVTSITIDKY